MYGINFVFDGIKSDEYNIMICSFDGIKSGETTAGSNIEFKYFKIPNSNKWGKISSTYNEQLSFSFQICKNPCSMESMFFSEREMAFVLRWLNKKEDKWLQIIQEGYEDIYFHCHIHPEKYEIGGQCIGFTLTATCDSPFGWSEIQSLSISSSASLSIKYYDPSDEIGIIYPNIEIVSKADNQEISIKNDLTSIETKIKNCSNGELITLGENMIVHSSECEPNIIGVGYSGKHKTFFDDFNWNWFSIGNTFDNRINTISVTGSCDIYMTWRYPRKAVV